MIIVVGIILLLSFILVAFIINRNTIRKNNDLNLQLMAEQTKNKLIMNEMDKLKGSLDKCTGKMQAYKEMKGE